MQRHVSAHARAEKAEASVQSPVEGQVLEHRPGVLQPRPCRGLLRDRGGLAAAPEVEACQREAGGRELGTQEEILVAVLGGPDTVAGDHAGDPFFSLGQMEDERQPAAGHRDRVALFDHFRLASPRSCLRQLGRVSARTTRSEEHTSELQSLAYLVCRLLLEKKKTRYNRKSRPIN